MMKTIALLSTMFLLAACSSTPPVPVDALKLCTDWCFANSEGAACVGMIRRPVILSNGASGIDYSPLCMPKESVGRMGEAPKGQKGPTNSSNPGKKK